MEEVLSKEELEAAHCWEAEDHVPRQPVLTEFRRRLRYHQAQWREANGHPIGSQPIAPQPDGGPARLVDRAVHTWWPDVPGTVADVRFAHSPARLDPAYLGNLVAIVKLNTGTTIAANAFKAAG